MTSEKQLKETEEKVIQAVLRKIHHVPVQNWRHCLHSRVWVGHQEYEGGIYRDRYSCGESYLSNLGGAEINIRFVRDYHFETKGRIGSVSEIYSPTYRQKRTITLKLRGEPLIEIESDYGDTKINRDLWKLNSVLEKIRIYRESEQYAEIERTKRKSSLEEALNILQNR